MLEEGVCISLQRGCQKLESLCEFAGAAAILAPLQSFEAELTRTAARTNQSRPRERVDTDGNQIEI